MSLVWPRFGVAFPNPQTTDNTDDAIQLFAAAIKKAGPDPAKIRDAVEQTKGFVSVDGTFNYSPTDHTGLGQEDIWVSQVTNGALVPTKYGNGK